MNQAEDRLVEAAREAFRSTRFYADLYGEGPSTRAEIPFLAASDYHRASGLVDCIVRREEMIGVLPPYWRDSGRFPFVAPEDEAELVLRQRRIVRAFRDLGVDLGGSLRTLIVADERRGPFACEVAKGIYWEGSQASIAYLEGQDEQVRLVVDLYDPDVVVLAAGRDLRGTLRRPRSSVIVVEHCGDRPVDDPGYPALLYADGVDLIGSRPPGREGFDVDPDQLLIEEEPTSGHSHVSKLRASCLPIIRYGLGRRVPVVDHREGGIP